MCSGPSLPTPSLPYRSPAPGWPVCVGPASPGCPAWLCLHWPSLWLCLHWPSLWLCLHWPSLRLSVLSLPLLLPPLSPLTQTSAGARPGRDVWAAGGKGAASPPSEEAPGGACSPSPQSHPALSLLLLSSAFTSLNLEAPSQHRGLGLGRGPAGAGSWVSRTSPVPQWAPGPGRAAGGL